LPRRVVQDYRGGEKREGGTPLRSHSYVTSHTRTRSNTRASHSGTDGLIGKGGTRRRTAGLENSILASR